MIKKLLFITLFFASVTLVAQTNTITIEWRFNSIPTASGDAKSSRTIEVGDTVIWRWIGDDSHNVISKEGSNESFESSYSSTSGFKFSKTFTSVGTNDYVCSPHSSIMFGTISVVAEGTLSIDTFDALGTINMYPNPTNANLTIDFQIQDIEKLNVKVFNLLGKEMLTKQISKNDSSVKVSNLNDGIYIVRITSLNGQNSITKRFVKN
ncbi:hypothetical protein BST83_09790 [Polaribacter filamentus]|uniref:Secretion system C-terminal sorting domain-containing protein n=1 Tax=Polaribacter filamentus TaxID=53483 RepID=A0A2S7KXS9_9FLAO|nr:T9SS type A sorting domain-containing protein [Polaribacter filamentus]PQB07420.1 hypothetical protein BST83_09790 [Polaribacter filamentus]